MATQAERDGLQRGLFWLLTTLVALLWLLGFLLLRTLAVAKRVTLLCCLVVLPCVVHVWLVAQQQDQVFIMLVAMILGVLLMHGLAPWWADYREKLRFLATANPASRRLCVDGDIYQHARPAQPLALAWRWIAVVATALVLFLCGWFAAPPDLRAGLSGTLCAVTAIAYLHLFGFLLLAERQSQVRYYLRGWRPVPIEAVEAWLAARPWGVRAVAWRTAVSGALAPVVRPLHDRVFVESTACAG